MRISTRGEYGMRAMLVLAENYGAQSMPLREIAEREQISEQYLEQLFRELRKKNLVLSRRGAKGGYMLARNPDQISIGEVLTVLEGPLGPMDCVLEDQQKDCCLHTDGCPTRIIWKKLKDAMDAVLDTTMLADLLAEAKKE